jgi:hypothetical protein
LPFFFYLKKKQKDHVNEFRSGFVVFWVFWVFFFFLKKKKKKRKERKGKGEGLTIFQSRTCSSDKE